MEDRYLTVTALTKYIKRKFASDSHLREVWLRGEISNFKHHSRGHMYCSIKDDQARIQAVMFAGYNRTLKFMPENGMNVLIRGEVSVYEPMGQYQLYIHDMQPDGIGALYLAFEQLKEKLELEGLFSESTKKDLPAFPKHIAIITSPTGAAIRDILSTIQRRYPMVKRTIIPVSVQGELAKASIVKAIEYANQAGEFDLIIVGRGGGSIEDLWSFNEEIVARAIYHSTVPIISAVGHETDFTISDFVADVRAATPTGAAELAVPSKDELVKQVQGLEKRLLRALEVKRAEASSQLERLKKSYAFKYPQQLMRQKEQELDRLLESMDRQMKVLVTQKKERLLHAQTRFNQQHPDQQVIQSTERLQQATAQLQKNFQLLYKEKVNTFNHMLSKLSILNPLEIMKRGFAIPYGQSGEVIKRVEEVQPGDAITVKVQNGRLDCQVWGIEEDENDER
ncbi:exodeoxyribonuclease VII large subunit [Thalassobacillus hwangdonensis]|uniref:Exodeoxyribonuclease 7 large subunit n=1 Tax=Thalassobacillus hwangdonensis TaxID=546108 RepID=A0ABW3L293_9BACI